MKFATENKILVAGHRGNPSEFPENTMASFQSAVEVGVDMIETDIHLTKDGVLVLMRMYLNTYIKLTEKNILYMDIIHIQLWKMSSSIRMNILIMLAIGQAEKMPKRNATIF